MHSEVHFHKISILRKFSAQHRSSRGGWLGTMIPPLAATRRKIILKRLLRAPVYLYRWRLGWLLGRRFLLLTHTGRYTGARHQTVLEVMEYRREGPEVVVMSGFGRNANWLRNIHAKPDPEVIVGSRRFVAAYRILDGAEGVRVLRGYERRNRFMAPVVRLVLSRLLGWKYHGTQSEQYRIVEQLPLIAFRPGA